MTPHRLQMRESYRVRERFNRRHKDCFPLELKHAEVSEAERLKSTFNSRKLIHTCVHVCIMQTFVYLSRTRV